MIGQTVFYSRDREGPSAKLSLIALMDIFTILVFFLLLNSGDSKDIEHAKFVELPNAAEGKAPHADLKIMVGTDYLWIEDEQVADVAGIMKDPEEIIAPLQELLVAHKEKMGKLSGYQKENGLSLTIMGQHDVPYALVRSVMATCRLEGFRNISLAVNRIVGEVQAGNMQIDPSISVGAGVGG